MFKFYSQYYYISKNVAIYFRKLTQMIQVLRNDERPILVWVHWWQVHVTTELMKVQNTNCGPCNNCEINQYSFTQAKIDFSIRFVHCPKTDSTCTYFKYTNYCLLLSMKRFKNVHSNSRKIVPEIASAQRFIPSASNVIMVFQRATFNWHKWHETSNKKSLNYKRLYRKQ